MALHQIPNLSVSSLSQDICKHCLVGKMCKLPFSCSMHNTIAPFELVHSYLWAPASHQSYNRFNHYIVFIDDYSRFTWIYPLVHKSDVYIIFPQFKAYVKNHFNHKLKVLRTDGGGEYSKSKFETLLLNNGILHQKSCPHTPQQNGVAERKHRHVVETAQNLGLPLVPPYFGGRNETGVTDFQKGVNFALVGASALDDSFFEERGIPNSYKNSSLKCQLSWFKDLLPSLCITSSDCNKLLQGSLFVLGEIGGDDYNCAFVAGRSLEEVESYVPLVVDAIASTINELIELGAITILVPGLLPPGCISSVLAAYIDSDKEEYDPTTGCLAWMNNFAEYHNEKLQTELNHIQQLHPHAVIIYADYFNAAMRIYHSPSKFGNLTTFKRCYHLVQVNSLSYAGPGIPFNLKSYMTNS